MGAAYVKDTPRTELLRCREADGALHPLPRQGSHAITSLAGATHLAVIPAERARGRRRGARPRLPPGLSGAAPVDLIAERVGGDP